MNSTPTHVDDVTLTVTVRWNEDVIAVRHLTGASSAAVGDIPASMARIPCDVMGAAGWMFASLAAGKARVSVPAGMTATRRAPDKNHVDLIEGPADAPLLRAESIELRLGAFLITALAEAPDAKRPRVPLGARAQAHRGAILPIGLAALAHGLVMGLAIQDSKASELDAEDARTADLKELLVAAEQRARALSVRVEQGLGATAGSDVNKRIGDGRDGGGERASGGPGAMGDKNSRSQEHRRYAAVERAPRDRDLSISREAALQDAAEFGMIGLLASTTPSPLAPWWGKEETRGADAIVATGEMWGQRIGSQYAPGGLELTGIGEGGGGRGEGIGLGTIGMLGHTTGRPGGGTGGGGAPSIGHGGGGSWGGGHWIGVGHIGRGHRIRVYHGGTYGYGVSGRLPPEAIQRIVRQNFGRFRACYQTGLTHAPALAGTVAVRFVIGRDGAVSSVADGGSSMPDPAVTSCVVRAFYGLSFPQPEGGIVTVTYPIRFEAS